MRLSAGCWARTEAPGPERRLLVPGLLALLVVLALAAALIGPYPLTLAQVAGAVRHGSAALRPAGSTVDTVLFGVRLPRIGAAVLVGGALAAAGAAYQNLFRNPLVSPDILGVSAGAGLGAVLGIFLSLPVLGIQLLAFVGGLGHRGPGLPRGHRRARARSASWSWCWPAWS